jgi:hypothetical protein
LRRGELTAGELAEHFDMAKPSLSHHFAVLKQADLIEPAAINSIASHSGLARTIRFSFTRPKPPSRSNSRASRNEVSRFKHLQRQYLGKCVSPNAFHFSVFPFRETK